MSKEQKAVDTEEAKRHPESDENAESDEKEAVKTKSMSAEEEKKNLNAAIQAYTNEERNDLAPVSFRQIFGGQIYQNPFVKRQVLWCIIVAVLMILYTANRYQSQQEVITIDSLRKEISKMNYNVRTQSSKLLNKTRLSSVQKYLNDTNDSLLSIPTTPLYVIKED